MAEKTLIILKPDCIQRALTGEIITRFENKGLKITAMKLAVISKEKAEYHYAEHKGKPFFDGLVEFITSGPVVLMVLQGDGAIMLARKLSGATKVEDALPGTIRGDFVLHTSRNIVHTSDGPESAKREIEAFFDDHEIIEYTRVVDSWI